MALIKWTPMDLFDDFERSWGDLPTRVMTPALDVYEDNDNVIVETPLPNIDPKDVSIEIEDNILKISGETKHKSEVDDKQYFRKEVRYGQFFRSVALPKSVAGERAAAAYKDGLLKISVPKTEAAKPKKIDVKVD